MKPSVSLTKPIRYAFLLLPNYSMITFSSAVGCLRAANYISGKQLYEWQLVTISGQPISASNGLEIAPVIPSSDLDLNNLEALIVCGGLMIDQACNQNTLKWLRKLANNKISLGALCTGSYLLAASGLLEGYHCTIHWENLASMRETFPNVLISSNLFAIDRDRFTCSGGNASLDMMLQLISKKQGAELVASISEMLILERIRDHYDIQRIPLRLQLGNNQPKLTEAVALMEANLEETISLDELAQYVGISRRQLERLFQKHLKCVPSRYYLELRLSRARQLLLQSNLSIIDISLACGFISAPHFSKCYRDFFGIPPRDERRRFSMAYKTLLLDESTVKLS
jgi:transcriptional regulator GlxA family with amidase domain